MQVCTIAAGKTAATESGRPFSPSQTVKNTSRVPRFLLSVSTFIENIADSPPAPAPVHNPRTSRLPARSPRSRRRKAGCRLGAPPCTQCSGEPSRTLTMMASMKTAAYTPCNGREAHACMPSTTLSVIRETVSLGTSAPYTSATCAAISPWSTPARRARARAPTSFRRRWCFLTITGLRCRPGPGARPPRPSRRCRSSPSWCGPVPGVAAVAADRGVLVVADVLAHPSSSADSSTSLVRTFNTLEGRS